MKHDDQVRLLKTLLARLDSGTNVDAGGFRRNPTSSYVDPELAALERREFFLGHPQMIGLTGDLPAPGSFLTFSELDVPVLATRDDGGRFRAFVNSCRHRGVVLEEQERGSTRRFACRFHNWTYDTAGTLVGLPKADHFGQPDQSCLGLIELPAVERHGLLFVSLDPQAGTAATSEEMSAALAAEIAADFGDELDAELAHWGFDDLVYLGQDTYPVACNWKLAMDTFGETYHFPVLHADTLANGFHGNVQVYDTFGRNHRMILCRRDIDEMRHQPEEDWRITIGGLPVYWIFPNVQLIPNQGGMQVVRAYPDPEHPGRHVSRIGFYLRSQYAESEDIVEVFTAMSRNFSEVIRDEDYVMSASQQRSADSGALSHVVFGRNEPALHHYHNTYRAALGHQQLPLLETIDG
ncbi:MAG: aromatic ring-hydroxylating dioxygenase subunit alpha [Actinomycetota bacterium]